MNKKILAIILISNLFSGVSFAQCNYGINLGDSYSKIFKDKYGNINTEDSISIYRESADKICASNTFKDVQVEYTFIYGELGSIKLIALNDSNNIVSNELTLMKYAKLNYGDFNTGDNPRAYNYFKVWKENNMVILYKRLLGSQNIWDESIYITNNKYRKKMAGISAVKENVLQGMMKEQ